jgi:hypothetical protein
LRVLGGRKSGYASVEMTKVRAALPRESRLGQKTFFITLGGPQAHDSSGRDDKVVAQFRASVGRKASKFPATTLSSRPERSEVEICGFLSFLG